MSTLPILSPSKRSCIWPRLVRSASAKKTRAARPAHGAAQWEQIAAEIARGCSAERRRWFETCVEKIRRFSASPWQPHAKMEMVNAEFDDAADATLRNYQRHQLMHFISKQGYLEPASQEGFAAVLAAQMPITPLPDTELPPHSDAAKPRSALCRALARCLFGDDPPPIAALMLGPAVTAFDLAIQRIIADAFGDEETSKTLHEKQELWQQAPRDF